MDCRFGRPNHYSIFNNISIPRITKELLWKLPECLSVEPIWMDCNCGKFINSNSLKLQKLCSPIWMDSNDLQFNIWNDFDLFPLPLSCFWVNEFFPILIVFNRFNPSILNVFTDPKQSSPISIDLTLMNREKSNTV